MYRIRDRALHALGQNLLDLLRDNRVLAVVQRVGLGCRLARGSASGVNLIWQRFLQSLRCSVLHALGYC